MGSRGGPSQLLVLSSAAKEPVKVIQELQSPIQDGLGPIHDAVCFEETEGKMWTQHRMNMLSAMQSQSDIHRTRKKEAPKFLSSTI